MSVKRRVDRLERGLEREVEELIEELVRRTRRLPEEQVNEILAMMEADLAGEDVEQTHPEALAVVNAIIAEVRGECAKAN